jgi:trans-aconitate methyltransferase
MSNAWDASLYDQKHSFVFRAAEGLLELLDPKPGERILDLGCGTGHLTAKISERGATVVGLDHSPDMLAAARKAYPQLVWVARDAADFAFATPFDAVFSNAVLHWVPDAAGAARCIANALRPGGRFVAEFGGKGNIAYIADALKTAVTEVAGIAIEHSWYYPSVGEYASLLERHGLEVRMAQLFDRPTNLEDGENGFRNWLTMFRAGLLDRVPELVRVAVLARAEEIARPALFRDGTWVADYRRLRVVAVRV